MYVNNNLKALSAIHVINLKKRIKFVKKSVKDSTIFTYITETDVILTWKHTNFNSS